MLFSSLIFLYAFLPLVLISNFLIKKKFRNGMLLVASLLFFAWGGVSYSLLLVFSLILNYFAGITIAKAKQRNKSKTILFIVIGLNLLMLGVFKYGNFVVENINFVFNIIGLKKINDPGIVLPLGISFYTFQALSYIIDVYRGAVKVQRNFFSLALYISFFPQLIAGPIVRYNLIEKQLAERRNHFTNLSHGIQRFVLGLSKKVLLANQFGAVVDVVFEIPQEQLNATTAWLGVLAYTMQIYYDFSGYSDMAIGLGRMFGFKLPENFNFPYISRTVREYWTRWHITLGIWFRNYLYFPLGGSRHGQNRTILNLLLVFFVTSIWHGASWNFVVWGMSHGFFMMLERLGLEKIVNKLWRPFQHFYALFIISVSRVFFRAETFDYSWAYFKKLFTWSFNEIHIDVLPFVNNKIFFIVCIIGVISSTPFWLIIGKKIKEWHYGINSHQLKYSLSSFKHLAVTILILFATLLTSMMLVGDTYNPFIYYRF